MRQRLFCVLMVVFWAAMVIPLAIAGDPYPR